MQDLIPFVAQYGLALVFANVLLDQLGAPIPAIPTLIVAGALAFDGTLSVWAVLAVAFVASMIADIAWFLAGRRWGNRVLRLLCRISLSPDACVRQAEIHFERWGGWMLPASKFIPGVSRVAPPLAGALRMGALTFLLWDSFGTAVWIGLSVAVGMLFHAQVDKVLVLMEDYGMRAMVAATALLAVYIAIKWWERARFFKALRVARVSADELNDLMKTNPDTVIVDVRSPTARVVDPRFIPGALELEESDALAQLSHLPRDREIVFYCTCPSEASAAAVAKKLIEVGYRRVRPLQGGLDAWIDAGLEIERRQSART